eukprot:gene2782-3457_t
MKNRKNSFDTQDNNNNNNIENKNNQGNLSKSSSSLLNTKSSLSSSTSNMNNDDKNNESKNPLSLSTLIPLNRNRKNSDPGLPQWYNDQQPQSPQGIPSNNNNQHQQYYINNQQPQLPYSNNSSPTLYINNSPPLQYSSDFNDKEHQLHPNNINNYSSLSFQKLSPDHSSPEFSPTFLSQQYYSPSPSSSPQLSHQQQSPNLSNNNNHSNTTISRSSSLSSSAILAKSGDDTITSNGKTKKPKKSYQSKLMGLVSFVLVITQILGIFMFSKGFFPRKTSLYGYNSFDNYLPSCTDQNITVEPQFGKMVFMLVDAFRSSFIFGEDDNAIVMNYTRSLIDSGRTHSFIARADAPTVTLPRVKALVSGGIPSFVDFINNFNSKDLKEDNILWQMKNANKSLLFFGDDTWLKLFPNYFKRYDGTTSFFVADTVEVDNNVTRHLDELDNNDWDAIFLHYLGLDHIGHLEGPYSRLMAPKQREIDGIIKRIHEKIIEIDDREMEIYKKKSLTDPTLKPPLPTLFIFCSDHGMNEIGNHGGSSDGETSAVLILISSLYDHQNDASLMDTPSISTRFRGKAASTHHVTQGRSEYEEREVIPKHPPKPPSEILQVDLVPSLSLLFNLPIPKNSLGKLIPDLFQKFISEEQYLRALEINCQQQIEILKNNVIFWKDNFPATPKIASLLKLFNDAQQFHSSWILTPTSSHFHTEAESKYIEFLNSLQNEFSQLLTSFDENLLIIGILLIGSSALVTLLITTATIALSEHQGSIEIKGVSFVLSFIGFVVLLLGIHFGVICFWQSNSMDTNQFCTREFRYGVFSFVFTALSLLIGFNAIVSRKNLKLWNYPTLSPLQLRKEKYVLIIGTVLHLISLFGSSLVEEEHLTWYYLTTSVILLQLAPHSISILYYYTNPTKFKQYSDSFRQMFILIGILVALRLFRIWNQTGIKWLDDTELLEENIYIDAGKYLNSNGYVNQLILWILSIISVVVPSAYVFKVLDNLQDKRGGIISQISLIYKITVCFLAVGIICYKWDYIPQQMVPSVYIARFDRVTTTNSYSNNAPSWFIATLKYVPTLLTINMTMLFLLIHKTHNMFLFTIMGGIAHYYLKYLVEDTGRRAKSGMVGVCVGMLCINWLGQFGYFAFGNSNSLSSIDISGSYTGLIDYNEYIVGILTFLIGYSSPLFFFFVSLVYSTHLAIKSINKTSKQQEPSLLLPTPVTSKDIIDELQWYSLIGSLLDCGIKWTNVFIFSMCIMIQRYHLFIWTVFSPKYIYEVLDVFLVLFKAICLTLFIIYLRILCKVRESSDTPTTSSQQSNKEE